MKILLIFSIVIVSIVLIYLYTWLIAIVQCPKRNKFRGKIHYNSDYRKYIFEEIAPEPGFTIINKKDLPSITTSIFSFSLYGNNKKYFDHMLKNVKDLNIFFPNWKVVIFLHDVTELDSWSQQLGAERNSIVIRVSDPIVRPGESAGMFWRFYPFVTGHKFVVLDSDDTVNEKLVEIIQKWEQQTNKPCFRYIEYGNFPWPSRHVRGKIWGSSQITVDEASLLEFRHRSTFGSDEMYLGYIMYPKFVEFGLLTIYSSVLSQISHKLAPPW